MAKITYFSLGGQDEKNKYSGVLEINNELFVLNAGIGSVINNQFGVEKVIPDIAYLSANADRIKAIFIGTPKYLNIGAIQYFLDILPDVPIYTSGLGKQIILAHLQECTLKNNKQYRPKIIIVNPVNEVMVGELKVSGVKVANSIPNSFSWLFKTTCNECVVFVDEFLIANENVPCCENQLHFITQHAKNKTALLIVGTQSVGKVTSFAYTQAQNFHFLKKACSSTKMRVVVACYEDDWNTLLNLSKIAKIYSMSFHIVCPKLTKLFNGYLDTIKRPIYAYAHQMFDTDDLLVVISGNHDTLYERLENILADRDAFKFKSNDLLIFSMVTYSEKEIEEINLINEISKKDIVIVKQPKSIIQYCAGDEDLKALINNISPFNVVTVNCYYKDYVNFCKCLENTINVNRIKFLELGQALTINGKENLISHVAVSEQYVNKDGILDINKSIVLERQLITQNGAVLVSIIYNQTKHSIVLSALELMSVFADDYKSFEMINASLTKHLNNDLGKYLTLNKIVDIKSLKNAIKRSVYQSLEHFTQKKPVVLPLITNLN